MVVFLGIRLLHTVSYYTNGVGYTGRGMAPSDKLMYYVKLGRGPSIDPPRAAEPCLTSKRPRVCNLGPHYLFYVKLRGG